MADTRPPVRYCLACGAENSHSGRICRQCGGDLTITSDDARYGAAFVLNELEQLRDEGEIAEDVYLRLRRRYRLKLGSPAEETVAAAAPSTPAAPRPVKPAPKEGPGWLVEQQANLLLYLGAFLIVMAALVYVGYSGRTISDAAKMVLLGIYTGVFLAAGLFCLRIPRVRQAGVVFFAVGALMVPINFVGAYAFFFADDEIDATSLWLAGSLVSAIFYGAVSLLGMGGWYPVPTIGALFSSLAAVLVLAGAPPEAYPGSFIALSLLLSAPGLVPLGRASATFGATASWAAHIAVPAGVIAALVIAQGSDDDREVVTRWFLPPTGVLAALFYWGHTLLGRRLSSSSRELLAIVALGASGGAAVTVVYALNVGSEWYGPAIAIVGWIYASASEGRGPRWIGQRHLGWMALATVTVSWLFFEGSYADFPRQGAGVHFAAAIFYLASGRLLKIELPFYAFGVTKQAGEERWFRLTPIPFIYAAGLTLGIGYYDVLASLSAAEGAEASAASWPFFGLSMAIALVAASMRWWWRDARVHVYAVALGMSLFVSLSSVEAEGQVALVLMLYAAVSLALTLWEREELALPIPAFYGFFAVLAAWRYFEPDDAYLPLVVSGIGLALFALYAALRSGAGPDRFFADRRPSWALVVEGLALAYAAAAPIVGWSRLGMLADERGLVGGRPFEQTLLYQLSTLAVLLLGVFGLAEWWLRRRVELIAAASVLLMIALLLEIGHFRPENVQAYTAPLGVYLLLAAFVALRVRALPETSRWLLRPLEVVGAGLIMAPSFGQSLDENAWRYGLILLAEGLGFVALGLVQRRLWLLGISISFVVADAGHYLFFAGGPTLPNWAILAIAGTVVMAAGTAILLGRDRWTALQAALLAWWEREPLGSSST